MDKRKNNGGHKTNGGAPKKEYSEPMITAQVKIPISDKKELHKIGASLREFKRVNKRRNKALEYKETLMTAKILIPISAKLEFQKIGESYLEKIRIKTKKEKRIIMKWYNSMNINQKINITKDYYYTPKKSLIEYIENLYDLNNTKK